MSSQPVKLVSNCPTGKDVQVSETAATNSLHFLWVMGGSKNLSTRVHECNLCEGWHLVNERTNADRDSKRPFQDIRARSLTAVTLIAVTLTALLLILVLANLWLVLAVLAVSAAVLLTSLTWQNPYPVLVIQVFVFVILTIALFSGYLPFFAK